MLTRIALITLLLGAPIAAQTINTPPTRPSTTSPNVPATPATPAVPSSAGVPASGDVHEAPPPMQTSAPPATAPGVDDKTDSKARPGDRPK